MTGGGRRRPPLLRAGAHVRLVAPAGPFPADLLAGGIAVLRSWGLEVSVGSHVLGARPALPYLAATDAARAADLRDAWCDPTVDAVLCVRGGYGCLRVLDLLDWAAMADAVAARAGGPPVFAGSSDVTALHEAFAARLGVATVFSPMIATQAFTGNPAAREGLRQALLGPGRPVTVSGPGAGALLPGVTGGVVGGVTTGGNASLLVALLGDPAARVPSPGSIVLLEDVNEAPYRIDRILTQLLRAGWFEQVAGIALGSFTDCGDPVVLREVLLDRLAGLGVPVAWGLRFGHCAGAATVALGVPAELDADTGRLVVSAPVTA